MGADMPGATTEVKKKDEGFKTTEHMLKAVVTALQNVYQNDRGALPLQEQNTLPRTLQDHSLFKITHDNVSLSLHNQRVAREDEVDPQANCSTKYLTMTQYDTTLLHMMDKASQPGMPPEEVAKLSRMQSKIAFSFQTGGRSKQTSQLRVCDFMAPRLMPNIGPCAYLAVPVPLRAAKSLRMGATSFLSVGPTFDPLRDPLRAIGENFFLEGTLYKTRTFSSDRKVWNRTCVWRGPKSPLEPMKYGYEYEFVKNMLCDDLGFFTKAVNHMWHGMPADLMIKKGVVHEVIMSFLGWEQNILDNNYLEPNQPIPHLAIGDWPGIESNDTTQVFHPRLCENVPESLMKKIAPWIYTVEEEVRQMGGKAGPSHRATPKALRYIMTLWVQGSLVLAPELPDHPGHKFLLSCPEFLRMLERYKKRLENGFWDKINKKGNKEFRPSLPKDQQEMLDKIDASLGLIRVVAKAVIMKDQLALARKRVAEVAHARSVYQQQLQQEQTSGGGTSSKPMPPKMLRAAPLPQFASFDLDDNDPDGKKYEEYLSLFDEPSHYHIRYPVRYHLDMMELGSAPYPPTGLGGGVPKFTVPIPVQPPMSPTSDTDRPVAVARERPAKKRKSGMLLCSPAQSPQPTLPPNHLPSGSRTIPAFALPSGPHSDAEKSVGTRRVVERGNLQHQHPPLDGRGSPSCQEQVPHGTCAEVPPEKPSNRSTMGSITTHLFSEPPRLGPSALTGHTVATICNGSDTGEKAIGSVEASDGFVAMEATGACNRTAQTGSTTLPTSTTSGTTLPSRLQARATSSMGTSSSGSLSAAMQSSCVLPAALPQTTQACPPLPPYTLQQWSQFPDFKTAWTTLTSPLNRPPPLRGLPRCDAVSMSTYKRMSSWYQVESIIKGYYFEGDITQHDAVVERISARIKSTTTLSTFFSKVPQQEKASLIRQWVCIDEPPLAEDLASKAV
mmetsp:Transcript_10587/g.26908  ORF Transcript_10587/g.26908 Transcript_10587/m.26908 type:complete len:950 (+) Transcript_10587:56-2905(+)